MNETLPGTFFCNKCGTLNTAGAQFCSQCGASMNPAASAAPTPGAMAGSPIAPAGANPYPPVVAYPGATPYPAAVPVSGLGYGGFWIRVVATIIDAIIVRVVVIPFGAIFGGMSMLPGIASGRPHLGMMMFGAGITLVLVLVGQWLYEAFLESSSYQATLGKMIFGMKVTDLNGNRISFARATGRHFAKIVSAMVLGIGFIMVGFTERKQGLHDLLAGTLVRRS
jgi:uncharacterized RDD family membrane protein YckC